MKIKDYKLFAKYNIKDICRKYGIISYVINEDGTVDVYGDVNLCNMRLNELPLRFGKVTGFFQCSKNRLVSLNGSPKQVNGFFSCKDIN